MITDYEQFCLLCGSPAVDCHHCLKGHKQRHLAEEDDLKIPVCRECHDQIHRGYKGMNVAVEIIGQLAYEKKKCAEGYGEAAARESFRIRYGRSYL